MSSPPLRIAVLECGPTFEKTRAKYGGYGGVFESLLRSAADTLDVPGLSSTSGLVVTKWEVVEKQEYPSLDDVDAVLLSGSKYSAFDQDPWILKLVDFTKEVLAQRRVRFIGVCFGHQILARALGVKVARSDVGWEVSVTAMDLTKKGQEVFGRTALAIHQMHRDIVFDLPPEVEQLAYTEKCAQQGMYVAKRLISVQGHPEFNEEIMNEILELRHEAGIFDDATFKDGMERANKYQDGVVVAQAFLRFLLE